MPNAFGRPEFVLPQVRQVPEMADLRLLAVESDAGLVGTLPLGPCSSLGGLPVPPGFRSDARVALGEPLALDGHEGPFVDALLDVVLGIRGRHWLRLTNLLATGPIARTLLHRARTDGLAVDLRTECRAILHRRAEPTYLTARPSRTLRRLRQQRAAFERATAPLQTVDRSDDPSAIEAFLRLEAEGWKGAAGIAHLGRTGEADALRETADAFRARGDLRVWCLQAGAETLAVKVNLVAGDRLFCYLAAFDEAHHRVSPGLQLEVENIGRFHDEPQLALMDSCANERAAFANRFFPDRQPMLSITLGDGVVGRGMVAALDPARRLRRRLRVSKEDDRLGR